MSLLLSMDICQALVDECKVTKDWAISRYDIIEKSYEMHPQTAAEQKKSPSASRDRKADGEMKAYCHTSFLGA